MLRWELAAEPLASRAAASAASYQSGVATSYFVGRACNGAGLCNETVPSLGVMQVSRGPAGGAAHLASPDSDATDGFLSHPTALVGNWSGFAAAGCPSLCGGERCYFDASCSDSPPGRGGLI